MRVAFCALFAVAALSLAGCTTDGGNSLSPGDTFGLKPNEAQAYASANPAHKSDAPTGAVGEGDAKASLLGSDPNDDLSNGKRFFRAGNFGMAERSFQRAVELHPRDAEAWLGLAAAYDRLKRFDLADRAYGQAITIAGPTVEILNNQGYSYMLRGDYGRSRQKLVEAQRKDPDNRYVANNMRMLTASARQGKAIQ